MERSRTARRTAGLIALLCALAVALAVVLAPLGSQVAYAAGADSAKADAAKATSAKADSSKADAGATREFTDSLGRTVEIPQDVTAIAASGPLAQQVLMTMAPDKLAGLSSELTDSQKKYFGEQYADLPVFGQFYGGKGTLNKEAVAAANPQVVIDVGEEKDGMAEDFDALQEQLGIPVVHVASTLATYDEAYTMLGELLGMPERGKELADYCAKAYEQVNSVMESIPEDQRVSVLYLTGDDGTSVLAKGSYQANVIDMVANNAAVVDDPSSRSNQTSLEQISNWNPQVIIFAPESYYDKAAGDPTWAALDAISSGSYYQVPAEPFNWLNGPPSVNQVLGMQWLPRILYQDKFDDNLHDVIAGYYKTFYGYELSQDEYNELTATAVPADMK